MTSHSRETFNEKIIPSHDRSPEIWDEALAAFENDLFRRGRSEHTIITYACALRAFPVFYRDQLKKPGPFISRIQETDFQAFIHYLRHDRHLSAVSVNRYIASLRAFSQFILVRGWHRRLIARDLKIYRIDVSKSPPRLSKAEVRRLITAVDLNGRNGTRDLAILQLFLQCGLRVSELVRLSQDDVALHKTIGTLCVRNEKGRQDRTIPLNTTVRQALYNHLDNRGPVTGSDPLFISERRQRMSIPTVQYLIKKYLCFAGREDLSTHDLRHHFAHEFFDRSGKLTATQQVLGHRDINTTARYARATDQEIQEAIDAIDNQS